MIKKVNLYSICYTTKCTIYGILSYDGVLGLL